MLSVSDDPVNYDDQPMIAIDSKCLIHIVYNIICFIIHSKSRYSTLLNPSGHINPNTRLYNIIQCYFLCCFITSI